MVSFLTSKKNNKIMEKLEKYSALAAKVLVVVTSIVLVFNLIRAVFS